jgi:hypothetical protein
MPESLDDDGLMAELRRIAADVDPVPDAVVAAAHAAIETRDVDRRLAELIAELVADSEATAPGQAFEAVRQGPDSPAADRLLSFAGEGVGVELEVVGGRGDLVLIGQITGAVAGACELERGDGRRLPVELDELGRFLVPRQGGGPVRLRCRRPDGRAVVTGWVNL